MYASVTIFSTAIEIERRRVLSTPARLVARRGQAVLPTDVVAESLVPAEHILLDAARALGVDPRRAAANIHVKPGAQVTKGDVLAGPVGLARRVLRAAQDGKVVIVRDGKILIEIISQPELLLAGYPGVVVDLLPETGVVIGVSGGLVQGVWGNGKLGGGNLILPTSEPAALPVELLTGLPDGAVVACGTVASAEVFSQAGLGGLILGSLPAGLASLAIQAPWPVIIVDGFGDSPFNPAAWEALGGLAGKQAWINAQSWDRLSGQRPEIVIPADEGAPAALSPRVELFMPGQRVRLLSCLEPGQTGVLVDLVGDVSFPGGLHAQAARLRLVQGDEITTPLSNLERLG